ncbi:MBL fold metallo-hydrolase [Nocardia sp. alder85J]|uniref:MBL fold metallo-hydrolase n=1 Tax=Nocardia sp. alder85J TaxID=2862949 RepID=UPI001CD28320|nr:MBL fold metallo-hydrolase [Nocardia sp. alder85J]MCX4098625.1 MBL fold metallo-hydrolase [Nocardia sp. alder85J]
MTDTSTGSLELLHVGGPTVRLRYGGLTWLTDPTFDAPRDYPGPITLHKLTPPAIPAAQVGPVDVVLLSHDQHADNLDITGREFLTAPTLSTPEAAQRIEGVRGLKDWETVRFGEVTVTAVPALHGPEGAEEFSGTVIGFVLHADGLPTVYVSGDNASVAYVRDIVARIGRIDVAVLHVGAANVGRFGDTDVTLNARTALEAAAELGDDTVIVPVHAEGWAHFTETVGHLELTFGYGGRAGQLRIPIAGVPLTI